MSAHRSIRDRLRHSWAELALGICCVVLAGIGNLALDESTEFATIEGHVAEPVDFSRTGQRLTVHRVEASHRVVAAGQVGGEALASKGHFLVVRLHLDSPRAVEEASLTCRLAQGGGGAQPVLMSTLSAPEPGYRKSIDVVFERPTGRLEGAELVCRPFDMIRAHSRQVVVDLGIDAARAAALQANDKPVEVDTLGLEEVLT